MNILMDVSLQKYSHFFPPPFELAFYKNAKEIPQLLKNKEVLLCRSTLKVNNALLGSHSLQCVASASSGVDHIDMDCLKKNNMPLFAAKGANAHAVADYVLACIAFMQTTGPCQGKQVGIIGLGAVGTEVALRLKRLQFDISYYDPLKPSIDTRFQIKALEEVLRADIICIHANLHDELPFPSRHLLGTKELSLLKNKAILINASRGDIVDEKALLALQTPIFYCTDVYANEPEISPEVIERASLCTPHIAGHSIEAKSNAVLMLSQQLHHYFHLPLPGFLKARAPQAWDCDNLQAWQERLLSFYNPWKETMALKAASNLPESFLSLRAAHNSRHDLLSIKKNARIADSSKPYEISLE